MNQEEKAKIIILGLIAVLAAAFLADLFYLKLLLAPVFTVFIACCLAFLLFEAYIRVQHNIDKISGIKSTLDKKINDDNNFHKSITDFFEDLISELEGMSSKSKDNAERLKAIKASLEELAATENEINEFQKKLAVLSEQILEYQKDQAIFLKEEVLKEKNGTAGL